MARGIRSHTVYGARPLAPPAFRASLTGTCPLSCAGWVYVGLSVASGVVFIVAVLAAILGEDDPRKHLISWRYLARVLNLRRCSGLPLAFFGFTFMAIAESNNHQGNQYACFKSPYIVGVFLIIASILTPVQSAVKRRNRARRKKIAEKASEQRAEARRQKARNARSGGTTKIPGRSLKVAPAPGAVGNRAFLEEARTQYIDTIAEENRAVEDAITGKSLSVDEQTILIGVDSSGAKAQRYQKFVAWPLFVGFLHPILTFVMIWASAQMWGLFSPDFQRGWSHDGVGDFLNMTFNILNVWLMVR